MNKRRMFGMLLAMVSIMGVLLLRILWLQTIARSEYSMRQVDLVKQSVLQREERLTLSTGRGDFYDRNGKPLTGEAYPALLVFPVSPDRQVKGEALTRLCRILGTTAAAWSEFSGDLETPRFWNGHLSSEAPARLTEAMTEDIAALHLEGVAVVSCDKRYIEPYPAAQLIGYINQDPDRIRDEFQPMLRAGRLAMNSLIGAAGLEKTFEPFISGLGPTTVSLYTDPYGDPIPGLGYRLHAPDNPYYPLQVITTLDSSLQEALESAADQGGLKDGAIVVLDARNGDILGMVSRPLYDPYHVDPLQDGWSNRALKEAAPGSIFKTVVAAAALEHGAASPDEGFECKGVWGKYGFTCWKKEGHGKLTFREAYAESCNLVFGQIMLRLTPEQLEETAGRLGIGMQTGWAGEMFKVPSFHQLDGEDAGTIWTAETSPDDEGVKLQTAIGQRDVRMTPLQAANMVVTLLNGGQATSVRAVKEIRYRTGRTFVSFHPKDISGHPGRVSSRTAATLLEWMGDVVKEGTGKALQEGRWTLAGKSGTAQTYDGAKELYNQWFIGYGPVESPRYAVAVASLRQRQSGPEAIRLFRQVMDLLANLEEKTARGEVTE